ncbi:helix-turn-helix domain-containing protein [Aquimarina pacifica]|uniref:helix-turn-helix domain-containing protein n=1 Tax=Aquimarina pacifica TaxID=1296415 RepID=UPI0004721BBE|nr:helix-turn-helix domain-containing protein [Aquimarina pacifica]
MNFSDIFLIIVSSAGFLHGILFAIYLCFFKKKKAVANILLSLILIFMALRVGKSVLLNFGNDLEPIFIFAGLAFILLIGPLLRWYVLAMTRPDFKVENIYLLELFPFLVLFIISFFVTKNWFDNNNKEAVIVFGSIIIFIYLHFAFYIFISSKLIQKVKNEFRDSLQTKSQKAILRWLYILIIGFLVIWISYFLNIIEDTVPYIVGPIMYSVVIYFLSYQAFQLKTTDIDGEAFKANDSVLFEEISNILITDKLYLESDVSLSKLSALVGKNTQKTSEVINQYAKQNFNDFVNYYRVQEAKQRLLDEKNKDFTISSIAYDTGFSSLSSFNAAFKKFVGTTPSSYKKKNII